MSVLAIILSCQSLLGLLTYAYYRKKWDESYSQKLAFIQETYTKKNDLLAKQYEELSFQLQELTKKHESLPCANPKNVNNIIENTVPEEFRTSASFLLYARPSNLDIDKLQSLVKGIKNGILRPLLERCKEEQYYEAAKILQKEIALRQVH